MASLTSQLAWLSQWENSQSIRVIQPETSSDTWKGSELITWAFSFFWGREGRTQRCRWPQTGCWRRWFQSGANRISRLPSVWGRDRSRSKVSKPRGDTLSWLNLSNVAVWSWKDDTTELRPSQWDRGPSELTARRGLHFWRQKAHPQWWVSSRGTRSCRVDSPVARDSPFSPLWTSRLAKSKQGETTSEKVKELKTRSWVW